MSVTLDTVLFTCEHCGADVRPGNYKGEPEPRNHCPACLWSKHVSADISRAGYPPCGGMMRPFDKGGHLILWRCLGCGFMMSGPEDDYLFRAFTSGMVQSVPGTVLYGR